MSRLVWIGVGAVGGIYLYRRGDRAWTNVKSRGVAGNASLVAGSAAKLLDHARTGLADAQDAKNARELQSGAALTELTPRIVSASGPHADPTAPVRDPQTQVVYEMRPTAAAGDPAGEGPGPEPGAPTAGSGGTAFDRVRIAARVLAGNNVPEQVSQNMSRKRSAN